MSVNKAGAVPLSIRYPAIFAQHPSVAAGESTRHGGVSREPYQSLNLGLYTDDDRQSVQENRRRFFAALGFEPEKVAGAYQVHGTAVLPVETAGQYQEYDALISNQSGILLSVTVADCTPVLIFDPVRRAVAAVHAGWRGTVGGIVSTTLAAMQRTYGTHPADCLAYIGTCIDECDYAVDADVGEQFNEEYARWDDEQRKFFVDLKSANRDQLIAAGLVPQHIGISPYSTVTHNKDYFSHRKEKGKTGRMLAVIGLR